MNRLLSVRKSGCNSANTHGIPSGNNIPSSTTSRIPILGGPLQTRFVSSLSELSVTETCALTRVIHATNFTSNNAGKLQTLIEALPVHLRSGKIVDRLPKGVTNLPGSAVLCQTHKHLNGRIVRNILSLIKEEAGFKLTTVVVYGMLTDEQKLAINIVRECHALWMEPAVFTQTLKYLGNRKWTFQADGCEACILARMGSDAQTLTALRTLVMSRMQTRNPKVKPPSLLSWVEAWIDTGVDSNALKIGIRDRSGRESIALKVIRKAAHAKRREAEGRKAGKGRRRSHRRRPEERVHEERPASRRDSNAPFWQSAQQFGTDDFRRRSVAGRTDTIANIIDSYASRESRTTQNLDLAYLTGTVNPIPPEEAGHVHPAFRNSDSVEVEEEPYRPISRSQLRRNAGLGAQELANQYQTLIPDPLFRGSGRHENGRSYVVDESRSSAYTDCSVASFYIDHDRDEGPEVLLEKTRNAPLAGGSARLDVSTSTVRDTTWADFYPSK